MSLAKIALALIEPVEVGRRSVVATVPVISLVTPRFSPWSTKNVPSVIRKLGIPVRTTR